MSIEVKIPAALRDFSGCRSKLSVTAPTVRAALQQIKQEQPALYRGICDETGAVRPHVNLFVNSKLVPVRVADGLETQLRAGDVLTIWPAVSGG